MIAFASAFPETLSVHPSTSQGDPRCWLIRTDDGVTLFITDKQADELAAQLRDRHGETKQARKAA